MAISEEARHRLFNRLEEVLGAEGASTLMEHLPPVGWADVATKRDLDHSNVLVRRDLDALGSGLRSEMATLGADLRSEMTTLGADLRVEIARASADTRASLRTLFLGLAGLQVSGAGLALAIARFS